MSHLELTYSGYACIPYLHNHESVELKEKFIHSKNIEKLYFSTASFSIEGKSYFSDISNHYLLAKFKDNSVLSKELTNHSNEKTIFVFNTCDELFQRGKIGSTNFFSIYYLEYGESDEDFHEIANLLLKRDKINAAGLGFMSTSSKIPSKFTFPYAENIVTIEVSSEKSHQSVKKYCDETKRDIVRKGLHLSNLLSLSILEVMK